MGSGGSARRLRGDLTEFAGWRAEPAPVSPAGHAGLPLRAAGLDLARAVGDVARFPLARASAVRGPVPGRTGPDG